MRVVPHSIAHFAIEVGRQAKFSKHDVENLQVRCRRRTPCVHNCYALRFAACDGEIAVAHAREEGTVFLLESVFILVAATVFRTLLVAAPGAVDAAGYVGVHENGQVGLQVVAQDAVKLECSGTSQFATRALIGLGGVGEAVAEDGFAFGHGGLDYFPDVLGTGGKHQSHLRQRTQLGGSGVQNEVSDFLSGSSPAGFAGHEDRHTACTQGLGELFDLRALARPVQAFEGDEPAALVVGRHWGMIKLAAPGRYWQVAEKAFNREARKETLRRMRRSPRPNT